MSISPRHHAYILLNSCPKIGPITVRKLLHHFQNNPELIIGQGRASLQMVDGMTKRRAEILHDHCRTFDLQADLQKIIQQDASFITEEDLAYPELLKEIYDPPIGLYWRGSKELSQLKIAIVGSRRTTQYGRAVAYNLAKELSSQGVCVVSGLARGIDTEVHKGALAGGGTTVAVLGNGLDRIYPPENLDLYKQILKQGAVISEFCYGRRADRQTFPMRNRIVSGMCDGVIVVESEARGGSLITAKFALEQGRSVFAVPGRVDQSTSQGCHDLIRDGAILLSKVEDVFEELQWSRQMEFQKEILTSSKERPRAGNTLESSILSLLEEGEAYSVDRIVESLGHPIQDIQTSLMLLELNAQIHRNEKGNYETQLL